MRVIAALVGLAVIAGCGGESDPPKRAAAPCTDAETTAFFKRLPRGTRTTPAAATFAAEYRRTLVPTAVVDTRKVYLPDGTSGIVQVGNGITPGLRDGIDAAYADRSPDKLTDVTAVEGVPLTFVDVSQTGSGPILLFGFPSCRVVAILAADEPSAETIATALFTP